MIRLIIVLVGLLVYGGAFANELPIDQQIEQVMRPISSLLISIVFYSITIGDISLPVILIWLVTAALAFTVYFDFISISGFKHAIKVIRGDFSDPKDPGEVSHFQALTTALSGTVGLGNIAGVAIAVTIGGPGATFWMIVAGLMGMSTKFLECSLGVKYRRINSAGQVHGGPMYYLRDGLANMGYNWLGKFLGAFFAICCVVASLCGSNMLQSNQVYQQFVNVMGGDTSFWSDKGWLFGTILALVIGSVILGGIRSIAKVTEKVVPLMAIIYLSTALYILGYHFTQIPTAVGLIIDGAFNAQGITGGIIGVIIVGFQRAAFSSEAGVGAASIAHAAASTKHPVREGYVALLEPFIDTVVICTITALVIVITGSYQNEEGLNGVLLTSSAFASVIWWFPYVLSFAVLMFGISTMISWAYYGSIAWGYLAGESKVADISYKLVFCVCTALGATISLQSVIEFSDSMFFSMAIANIIGLFILAPEIRLDLKAYRAQFDHK